MKHKHDKKKALLPVLIGVVIVAGFALLGANAYLRQPPAPTAQPTAEPVTEATAAPQTTAPQTAAPLPEDTVAPQAEATPAPTPIPEEDPPLDLASLPGYFDGGADVGGIPLPLAIPNTNLVIAGIGQYSGPFVEDGSGEPMANVMTLIVKNNGYTLAEYAEITLAVAGKEPAVFQLSGVPGKDYVLVMEKNRRPFDPSEQLSYETHLFAERDDVSLQADKVQIYAEENALAAKNLTGETLDAVYIRYKSVLVPRCYLGGITYSCKLEKLAPGDTQAAQTGHFAEAYSQIVMVETMQN